MELDKVIVRAFLMTLAAICSLLVFIVLGLCAVFPATSMELAYDMGMGDSCIHFAERAYKSSHDVYFIAYATEVAIEEGETSKIVSCGEKLIGDEEFEGYCEAKSTTYRQFIYGRIAVAKYQSGDKNGAVALACQSLQGAFPEGNALVAVLLASLTENDMDTVEIIKNQLNMMSVEGDDAVYLQNTLAMLGN